MKRGTILIYEPDNELSKSLALVLENEFEIITSFKMEEAVENAILKNVNTLILDLSPEELNIRDKINKVHIKSPDTKIILLYVYTDIAEKSGRSIREKADAVLYKPLEIGKFVKTVKKVNSIGN